MERSTSGAQTLPADLVESFLFPFPPSNFSDPEVIPKAQEYYDQMLKLLSVLHQITASALGVTLAYFNSHYNPLDANQLHKEVTGFYLRFAYYPPISAAM